MKSNISPIFLRYWLGAALLSSVAIVGILQSNAPLNDATSQWVSPADEAVVGQAVTEATSRIQELAIKDPGAFATILRQALGPRLGDATERNFVRQAVHRQLPLPGRILFVPDEVLSPAAAAYTSEDGGVIFLGARFRTEVQHLPDLILHEWGHHLDALLESGDSPFEEGEVFHLGVNHGEPISNALARRHAPEYGHATIDFEGRSIAVEGSWLNPLSWVKTVVKVATNAAKKALDVAQNVGKTIVNTTVGVAKLGAGVVHKALGNDAKADELFNGGLNAVARGGQNILDNASAFGEAVNESAEIMNKEVPGLGTAFQIGASLTPAGPYLATSQAVTATIDGFQNGGIAEGLTAGVFGIGNVALSKLGGTGKGLPKSWVGKGLGLGKDAARSVAEDTAMNIAQNTVLDVVTADDGTVSAPILKSMSAPITSVAIEKAKADAAAQALAAEKAKADAAAQALAAEKAKADAAAQALAAEKAKADEERRLEVEAKRQADIEKQRAENERLRAENERLRKETEAAEKADAAAQALAAEKAKADAAQAREATSQSGDTKYTHQVFFESDDAPKDANFYITAGGEFVSVDAAGAETRQGELVESEDEHFAGDILDDAGGRVSVDQEGLVWYWDDVKASWTELGRVVALGAVSEESSERPPAKADAAQAQLVGSWHIDDVTLTFFEDGIFESINGPLASSFHYSFPEPGAIAMRPTGTDDPWQVAAYSIEGNQLVIAGGGRQDHWTRLDAAGLARIERGRRLAAEKKAQDDNAARQAQDNAARQAQDNAARQARDNAARQARDAAALKARNDAARRARDAAALKARNDAARRARDAAAKKARDAAALKARNDAAREARAAAASRALLQGEWVDDQDNMFTVDNSRFELRIQGDVAASGMYSVPKAGAFQFYSGGTTLTFNFAVQGDRLTLSDRKGTMYFKRW